MTDTNRIATIAKWRKANVVGSWCGISGCPCRAFPVTARTSQEMYAGIREHIEYVRSAQGKAQ